MDENVRKKLSEALVRARLYKGYTQNDLASLLCISRKALSDYECGVNLPPLDRLADLIRVLDDDQLRYTVAHFLNLAVIDTKNQTIGENHE